MSVKYKDYRSATDRSMLRMASSEGEMEYNTNQVLASGGAINKSLALRLKNPGSGPELTWIMNESGPGDTGAVGLT